MWKSKWGRCRCKLPTNESRLRTKPRKKQSRYKLVQVIAATPFRWWLEHLKQALGQAGIVENGTEQDQAHARIFVPRDANQSLMQIEVAVKALGAVDEPEIHLIFHCADIGDELSRVAFGIVNEVARMHLEKSG